MPFNLHRLLKKHLSVILPFWLMLSEISQKKCQITAMLLLICFFRFTNYLILVTLKV
ncbi:hypothetical protein SAMN03084138_03844 [Enterovibrio norvegicus DSM 15893]|uniref:Uncharacterized protein n=1 Tax=Enterovibrio norvegicus DSM 15893 TaxID=1121869 RepID=A0A1I5V682_9GAMM|nr:hypothetical protein SAMN03084138_03844 [Enterovibrio norvegicus DSM 15893]